MGAPDLGPSSRVRHVETDFYLTPWITPAVASLGRWSQARRHADRTLAAYHRHRGCRVYRLDRFEMRHRYVLQRSSGPASSAQRPRGNLRSSPSASAGSSPDSTAGRRRAGELRLHRAVEQHDRPQHVNRAKRTDAAGVSFRRLRGSR